MKVKNVADGPAPAAAAAKPAANAPAGIEVVTDSLGRKITLKKLKPSQRFLLDEVAPAQTLQSGYQTYFAGSVIAIDQDGLPPLESKKELLARLDELGDEGLEAIFVPCAKMYGLDALLPGKDQKDTKAKTKNS